MLTPGGCWGQVAAANDTGFRRVSTIPLTANGTNPFDICWVDPVNGRYYLADRSSKSIDIVDTKTNAMVGQIGGFVGQSPKGPRSYGPSGVVVIPGSQQAWAGDGDSTVKVIDLRSKKIIDSISTGDVARADEIAYDDKDHVIIIGNDADEPVFLTLISAQPGHRILGKIVLPEATDGLDQPVWTARWEDSTSRFLPRKPIRAARLLPSIPWRGRSPTGFRWKAAILTAWRWDRRKTCSSAAAPRR